MTVLQTGGGLILHSPVALTPDDLRAIPALGDVHAILAPNLFHHLFLRDCIAAFPSVRVLVPKGLDKKVGCIPNAEMMGPDVELPVEVAHFTFDRHRYLKETLLFHRPSRTLVTADLIYNYHQEHHLAERTFFRLIGCYGAPNVAFYHRLSIRDPDAVRRLVGWVQAMNPLRIVMSHGRIIESKDAATLFARAWAPFT